MLYTNDLFLSFVMISLSKYNKIEHFGHSAENSALNNRALENKYTRLFSTDRIVYFRPVEGSPSYIS